MATITKRTTSRGVTYRAAVRRAGHPNVSKAFSSLKAAQQWARKVEADTEALKAGTAAAERVTFAQCAEQYLAAYRGKDESRAARIAPFTAEFGSTKLAAVTPDHIRAVLDRLESGAALHGNGRGRRATAGRPCGGATINRYVAAVSVVFKHAMQHHGLRENPCHRVGQRQEGKPRDRVLTDAEQTALLAACRRSSWGRLHLLVLMACTTGARRGELLKLRWSNIDWRSRATDPDSSVMVGRDGFVQAYNCQFAVDEQAQIIVALGVTDQSPDAQHLLPMLHRIQANLDAEWNFVALCHNILKLFRHRGTAKPMVPVPAG